MKHGKLTLVAAFLCALVLGGSLSSVHAAQITNVSATASSYYNSTYHPVYAVNGAGLDGSMHGTVPENFMWATKSGDIDGAYFIIDLKMNYKLDSINTLKVWNYNQEGQVGAGIKAAAFSYSIDSLTFTEVTNVTTDAITNTFDQAPGLSTYSNYNTITFNTSPTARHIKITVNGGISNGNYGHAASVGLSEVQAFGTFVSDPANSLGAQISVSNVTASSTYTGYGPTNLINGSGLTGLVHDTNANNMWFSNTGVTNAYVDFDLGMSQKLGAVRIWNWNWDGDSGSRGMRTVDILVSDDDTFSSGVTTNHNDIELLRAPFGLQDYDNPQIFDMNGVEGRYVRISTMGNSDPNWGAAYVGLSEVQFFLFVPGPPSGTAFWVR